MNSFKKYQADALYGSPDGTPMHTNKQQEDKGYHRPLSGVAAGVVKVYRPALHVDGVSL